METTIHMPIPVIDLFAGPGGLNEGFSAFRDENGDSHFKTISSIEMESSAVQTLKLRSVFREVQHLSMQSDLYYSFLRQEITMQQFLDHPLIADIYKRTSEHIAQIEMGPDNREETQLHISTGLESFPGVLPVLIGGPPCQAYSLAGRSRRKHDELFSQDKKHFLYQEYLAILGKFSPAVFVMENVKGLLSSRSTGESMFSRIIQDLRNPTFGVEYNIYSLVTDTPTDKLLPNDFVIKSENYGIPQKRHRVILLGIRADLDITQGEFSRLNTTEQVTVKQAIGGLPSLRSGVSPQSADSESEWLRITENIDEPKFGRGGPYIPNEAESSKTKFSNWISDPLIGGVIQHATRAHMESDLRRYKYMSKLAAETGQSPTLRDLPQELLPNHKSAEGEIRPFEDRFRVQTWHKPSTTIVSHISKDGHYYIHPDSLQSRSLTVREAARLQTFPDNYFFCGNRTQQFHQVGNAVPPLLAVQIAEIVREIYSRIITA